MLLCISQESQYITNHIMIPICTSKLCFDTLKYLDNAIDWSITNILLNILEVKKCFSCSNFNQTKEKLIMLLIVQLNLDLLIQIMFYVVIFLPFSSLSRNCELRNLLLHLLVLNEIRVFIFLKKFNNNITKNFITKGLQSGKCNHQSTKSNLIKRLLCY